MRRRLLIGGGALGVIALVGGLGVWLFYGRIAEWVVREKVLPKVERKLGRKVAVEHIEVERGRVILRGISIPGDPDDSRPLVEIASVSATFDYGASWKGDAIVRDITIDGLQAHPRRRADGSDNFRELAHRLSGHGDEKGQDDPGDHAQRGLGSLRPRSVRMIDSRLEFEDETTGAQVVASSVTAITDQSEEAVITLGHVEFKPPSGPKASLGEVIVNIDVTDPLHSARADVGSGQVTLWKGMSLTGIKGVVEQGKREGQLVIDLNGSYGGSTEMLWHADGWVEPEKRQGQLSIAADRFTLDRIAPVLRDSVIKDFDDTSIDAQLAIDVEKGVVDLVGRLSVSGLNVNHPMLSLETMRNIGVDGEFMAHFDSQARTLQLSSMSVQSKGVTYELSGHVALKGGFESDGSRREFANMDAHLVVPKADCQAVLNSIPAEFIPRLQGFSLQGPFAADVKLAIDWSDLQGLTVLDGFVDLPKCKILAPNEEFDAKRLTNSFEHQILVGPEEYETVDIGLESDNYAQIFDISPYFLNAVITQEDSRFYDHHGFITREFRSALVRNLEAGRFKFGASSITMQMVKNVFLYRDKTISRKLQELFLTWYVEQVLDKNRILEIYVNAIEYGPAVYGIVQASSIYFDKHPRNLEAQEAAFLAQLLPSPRRRYFQYCKATLDKRTKTKVERVLTNMHKRNRLSDSDYEMAKTAPIEFNPEKVVELCKKQPDW